MSSPVGLVGRLVVCKVKRGEITLPEVCEVMACQTGGHSGSYQILVATHDGRLLDVTVSQIKLAMAPFSEPYR